MDNHARCLDLQEKLDDSEKLFRGVLDVSKRVKTDTWFHVRVQVRLGSVLMRAKKNSGEAKQLIEEGYAKLREESENIPAAMRQKVLDEAEAAMKLIEPAK